MVSISDTNRPNGHMTQKLTSLLRQNDAAMSFWRNNDVSVALEDKGVYHSDNTSYKKFNSRMHLNFFCVYLLSIVLCCCINYFVPISVVSRRHGRLKPGLSQINGGCSGGWGIPQLAWLVAVNRLFVLATGTNSNHLRPMICMFIAPISSKILHSLQFG